MERKFTEHILSLLVIGIGLTLVMMLGGGSREEKKTAGDTRIRQILKQDFVDINDPFHQALLKDLTRLYFPGSGENLQAVLRAEQENMLNRLQSSHLQETLSVAKTVQLLGMYAKFLLIYILVMLITYYGVQTLGVLRFVLKKQRARIQSGAERKKPSRFLSALRTGIKKTGLFVLSMVLFSPAYVIAYSLRLEFSTDIFIFVILLGAVSNGLLMMYTNKFFSYLTAESRRGYVETARVKNLNGSYLINGSGGIPLRDILSPAKQFNGHVFGHIYRNARHQYLPAVKEQASFLITGLIIIEMALNIHGYLSYEMLRQLLFGHYDIVAAVILMIFFTVKLTEIFTDLWADRTAARYSNLPGKTGRGRGAGHA